jgi:phosphoribosylformimino-5-aminoimidazole carboxamide ribotide isomerase
MRIYPAIDLINGQCVRLKKGSFDDKKIYSDNPLAIAQYFEKSGLNYLHIVDLDGARTGKFQQELIIEKILMHTSLKIQVGGGIRSEKTIDKLIDIGAERIILGSMATENKDSTVKFIEKYPGKLVLALDLFFENDNPQVVSSGWQKSAKQTLWQLLDFYQSFRDLHFLCTDVARDGLLQGPNFKLYETCYERYPTQNFIVSGGIKKITDVTYFKSLPNVSGVILGTAIYENHISVEELVKC